MQGHFLTGDNRRQFERFDVSLEGEAHFTSGQTSVKIVDLSLGGAGLILPLPLPAYGAELEALRLPGVAFLKCRRRWSRDRQVGVEFRDQPQAAAALRPLLATLADQADQAVRRTAG
ncbi:PilZ domain-containing protein [Pseudooceanicola sp. C21-150M6]|uniref:PilZ domain-containing protein n=1 Tax=Pseudooceanicola sp. C21-150M6 TaxID=3434355 RepID=UPI003D7F5B26